MRMTTEEAFVKTLQRHGIEHAFGIIGSAFMPISDLFPRAGISFWDCAHEGSGGMMADGFTRASGRMCMMIAQNGPGITNFVTAVKTAYWNHTPLLLVTPQAANKTIGQGGFQEIPQMALFADMVCYQEEVRDPARIAEVLNRVILNARRRSAPAQINIPRDYWTQVIDIDLPEPVGFDPPAGGTTAIAEAARLLSGARFPVILNGAGVVIGGAIPAAMALAERLDAPVCVGYQHNDAFPGSHPLFAGPLGYNGSKAAMELIAQADVVLALGTRLNPFSTLPGYGIDYWPKGAQIIQVDINPDRIGLTKKVSVGIVGDARAVAEAILAQLAPEAGDEGRAARRAEIAQRKSAWAQQLASMDHEDDDPGTTWNQRARAAKPDWMSPRMAWRAITAALPKEAIISSDIGNNCAIGNAYPSFESGRKYLAPGLFGPCGYGLPAVVGAKIAWPRHAGRGLCRRRGLRHRGQRADRHRSARMAGDHHGGVPQLSVGGGKAQLDPVVRRQFRRDRTGYRGQLCRHRPGLRVARGGGAHHGRADRGPAPGGHRPDAAWQDDTDRGDDQPGTGRALPPRRDEGAGGGGRDRSGRHAPAGLSAPVPAAVPRPGTAAGLREHAGGGGCAARYSPVAIARVTAVAATMSSVVAPRLRSQTGRRKPCRKGPTACAPASS